MAQSEYAGAPQLRTQAVPGYRPMPILLDEDDHFGIHQARSNLTDAVAGYAGRGYFDPGYSSYGDGCQCPPAERGINTPRKRAFFERVLEIAGG
ncbi:MAG TPA: hypothetical protein VLH79_09930 [Chthonomonadales bacterium]|nr:hypothetical protein [Chthonomonadales bacterium]